MIIACGAAEADGPCPAAELYTGFYFTSCLRAARALVADDAIRILSARHGLLALDEQVAPSEHRLSRSAGRAGLATVVCEQARAAGLSDHRVVVFGGRGYTALAREAGWTHVSAPLSELSGIGYQRRHLAEMTRRSHSG